MNNQNDCTKYREDIAALVLDLLEPKETEMLQIHLETCQDCKALYQNMLNEEKAIRASFKEIGQIGKVIQNSLIEKLDNETLETIEKPKIVKINRSKLIRNPLIKVAAAAAIIIFVLFMGQSEDNTLWAKAIKALEQVNSLHMTECYTDSDNEKRIDNEYWIKKPNLLRNENSRELKIDNGIQELTLNKKQKTAQTLDSQQQNYPIVKYMFAFIGMLNEPTSDFEKEVPILAKVPEECTDEVFVYDAHYKPEPNHKRIPMKFRIWVDSKNNLFTRFIALPGEDNPGLTEKMELFFDYEEIPDEIFTLNIPDEYTIVDPPKQSVFSGTVLDQNGSPVDGVEVHIIGGSRNLTGKTDYNGNFKITHQTSLGGRLEFPILVRAFRKDFANEIAWTIIQDPQDNQTLVVNPPNPGNIEISIDPNESVFGNCTGVTGILLKMQPALQITGKVTDKNSNGLAGAEVTLQNLRLSKQNDLSSRNTWIKASCTTDSQGNYVLGSLPNLPKNFPIELVASKDNYIKSDGIEMLLDNTLEQAGPDFSLSNGGVTIKGFVKNSDGDSLPCYNIWHTVNGERVGTVTSLHEDGGEGSYAITGKNGEFELINCPAMEGLSITASGVSKSPFWDMYMRNWKLEREFEYYDEKTVDIGYEPGKNEYTIEIVLTKASRTVEFEVKGFDGQPVDNAEVRLGAFSNRANPFKAVTDTTGKCVFNKIPWEKQWQLTVIPKDDSNYNMLISATLDFSNSIKKYKVEIVLQDKYKYEPSLKVVNVINLEN